jgi:hypothetical protein
VSICVVSDDVPLVVPPLFILPSEELLDVESVVLLLSPELQATANNKALPKMIFFMVLCFTFNNYITACEKVRICSNFLPCILL